MAIREVRRDLHQGIRASDRACSIAEAILQLLQLRAPTSGTGWKDTGQAILRHSGSPEGCIIRIRAEREHLKLPC